MAWDPIFSFSVTWENITEKPNSFPSTWATVSGKPETATRWPTWGEVTGKPAVALASQFTYIGSVSGGTYYDHLPSGNAVSYLFHAAGNSPTDAPASPDRQTAVLGLGTSWGIAQLAITHESVPQVFVRGNGAIPWNRVWTAGDFDPTTKFDNPTGTTAQYIRGNGTLATFPAIPAGTVTSVTGGNGLTGSVTSSGSISLGTPGTLTRSSTNTVTATSHTHELSSDVFVGRNTLSTDDLNDRGDESGYATVATQANVTTDRNYPWNGGGGSLLTLATTASTAYRTQIFHTRNGSRIAYRARSAADTWTDWRELWHSGNFDPATKFDSPTGTTSQYIRGNGSLATFPNIPTSTDFVATTGNQTGLGGTKAWTAAHSWNSGSVVNIHAARNNSNVNSLIQTSTNRGSVYFGYGNASGTDHFTAGTVSNLTASAAFFYADSSGMTVNGAIFDSIGNVRKPEFRTANNTITLNSNDVNRIVEKSNNTSYTFTIPSGHGSHGDIITFVNSGTAGTLTINAASGVTIYRNGVSGNIRVGPGSTVTVYRSATANRWIA